jgi:hypothetical protein
MLHDLGGLAALIAVIWLLGRPLVRQGARSWDVVCPGTRPSRQQVREWAVPRMRSAAQAARSTTVVFARPPGSRRPRVHVVVVDGAPDDDGAPDGTPPAGPAGTAGPAPGKPGPARPPSPAAPPAQPATAATGRTATTVTTPAGSSATVPGAEEMTSGMAALRAYAVNGNARQKQGTFRAVSEVWEQDAAMVRALAQSMMEADQYSAGIIESVDEMAAVLGALATRAAETEGLIASLLAKTGDEMIDGGDAPHRSQLTDAGGR